uniref:Uncharacterized protein n=1 Tax=Panagrolaimus davidi TaxID=227884 RepID=A0A914QBJ0_9BILA
MMKNNTKKQWDSISLEVGDPKKWENQFKPQFGPNNEQIKYVDVLIDIVKEKNEENAELVKKIEVKNEEFKAAQENIKEKDKIIFDNLDQLQTKDYELNTLRVDYLQKEEEINDLETENQKNQAKLEQLRKLNKDKANKLNYKGFTSAAGPSKALTHEEPLPKKAKIMENGREYCMEFVMLCVQLSWLGIKDLKIPQAISIITSYFNIDVERLPDHSTVSWWCSEQVVFIDAQINEFFDNADNLTVYSDETTLSGDKLQSYIISKIINGVRTFMVVGIEQVPDKSAARSLKAFIACMKRTVDVFRNLSEDVIEEILTERLGKIVNVVGDRASTQKKWNRDLGAATGKELNEIFCQHHILSSSWDVFIDTCLQFEKVIFNNANLKSSKIKAAAEAISTNLGERSGSHQKAKEWKTWAEEHGLEHAQFPSKLGSRWNIGFSIMAVLLHHRENLLKFLQETNYKAESCFSSLIEVLKTPAYINMVRIGAAIDQVINGPWWAEIETHKHISEIHTVNAQIIEYLEKIVDMVPVFYQKFVDYLKKQFQHLTENSKINDPAFENELASAAASNKVCEQTFAIATYYRKQSASTSNVRLGYTVSAAKNNTASWYNNKTPKERKSMNVAAREARKRVRKQLKEQKKALKKELVEAQKKKQAQQVKKKTPPEATDESLDRHIGANFKQIWEDEEDEECVCSGYVKQKIDEGYILYYPASTDEDEDDVETYVSSAEFDTLIATGKIIFD